MPLITLMQLLPGTTLVDTNHGDSDGPCCFTDTESQVSIVRIHVTAFLSCLDDLNNRLKDTFVDVAFLKFAK